MTFTQVCFLVAKIYIDISTFTQVRLPGILSSTVPNSWQATCSKFIQQVIRFFQAFIVHQRSDPVLVIETVNQILLSRSTGSHIIRGGLFDMKLYIICCIWKYSDVTIHKDVQVSHTYEWVQCRLNMCSVDTHHLHICYKSHPSIELSFGCFLWHKALP